MAASCVCCVVLVAVCDGQINCSGYNYRVCYCLCVCICVCLIVCAYVCVSNCVWHTHLKIPIFGNSPGFWNSNKTLFGACAVLSLLSSHPFTKPQPTVIRSLLQPIVHGATLTSFHLLLTQDTATERGQFQNDNYWFFREEGQTENAVAIVRRFCAYLQSGHKNKHSDVFVCSKIVCKNACCMAVSVSVFVAWRIG